MTKEPASLWEIAKDAVSVMLSASVRRTKKRQPGLSNSDYSALKAAIKSKGLLTPQPGYYALVFLMNVLLLLCCILWITFVKSPALFFLVAPLLSFVSGQFTLLGHEAAHHAIAARRSTNDLLSLLCINLFNGGNFRWWASSHNEHHARSNERLSDPDIEYPFFAFSLAQARQKPAAVYPLLRSQHLLVPLLMCLVGLSLRAYSLVFFLRRGGRPLEIVSAALYYVVYPLAIFSALGPLHGVLFVLVHQILFGLYLGSVTSVNHWGMPMPDDFHGLDYLRHQVSTSRNLRSGALADIWFGGLNRQIEHHLFPTMPRNQLRCAAPIVREFCQRRGIPYHEVSILGGYKEVYVALKTVANGFDGEMQ